MQTTATLTIVNSDSAVAFSSAFYTQAKNTPTGVAVIDVLRAGGTNTTASVGFYTTSRMARPSSARIIIRRMAP